MYVHAKTAHRIGMREMQGIGLIAGEPPERAEVPYSTRRKMIPARATINPTIVTLPP